MTDLPEPLTPPECDLRGMEWMPLHGHKLYGSDFDAIASDAEYRAAQRLWWAAWQQQVPAASLPDDDRVLAHIAGYSRDPKGWAKIRAAALHAFIKCSDDRLYHRFLAPEAIIAWEKRVKERERKAQYRAKKGGGDDGNSDGQDAPVPRDRPRDGPRTGQPGAAEVPIPSHVDNTTQDRTGQDNLRKKEKEPPIAPSPNSLAATKPGRRGAGGDPDFETFWLAYPRKVGKGQARKAWDAAIRKMSSGGIIAAVRSQRFDPREQYQPHPSTWLNGERWLDGHQSGDPVLRAVGLNDDGTMIHTPDPRWSQLQ